MPTFRKFAFPDGATAEKLLGESLQPLDFAVQKCGTAFVESLTNIGMAFRQHCKLGQPLEINTVTELNFGLPRQLKTTNTMLKVKYNI